MAATATRRTIDAIMEIPPPVRSVCSDYSRRGGRWPMRRYGRACCGPDGLTSLRSSPRKRGPRLGDVRVHSALKTRVNALMAPGSLLRRGRTEGVVDIERLQSQDRSITVP